MTAKKLDEHGWPQDGQYLDFEKICAPLVKALRFAFKLTRKNRDKDIPYKGPNIGPRERASCLSAKHQLSAEMLQYSEEDQGRKADEEIIGLAELVLDIILTLVPNIIHHLVDICLWQFGARVFGKLFGRRDPIVV
jgi:hypothetical protein